MIKKWIKQKYFIDFDALSASCYWDTELRKPKKHAEECILMY